MKSLAVFIICFLGLFLVSCENESKKEEVKPQWTKEQSTNLNRSFAREEEIRIKLYLNQRKNWDVKETGSGLRYWIYEDKEGEVVKSYDQVDVRFEIKLLTDSLLYKTEVGEISTFKVDKSDIESGVMEGIKYMSEGDKAKMIIPSHLGHGLLGDFQNIPPLEVLVVDLELVKIH